jgi:cellulose synthase (UDP-forming)
MGLPLSESDTRIRARPERDDPRLRPAKWAWRGVPRLRLAALVTLDVALAAFYFSWLLRPARVGSPVLYGLLLAAELFNLTQAAGFWWTVLGARGYRPRGWQGKPPTVDVLIPVYGESVDIVEPTVAAARRMHGARVHVHLLDDGRDPLMRELAARQRVHYVTRKLHVGAKAGNINHALALTRAPYVVILDCDHVPDPRLLSVTLGHLQDERMAFVQTPQYYANAPAGGIAAAAWAQQALFFGAIAAGKDGHGAMFCAGTNVVFARAALEEVAGFPEGSLTEDFELSIALHERGWRSRYVPVVLARGLGPEDMSSYVSQQQRWARGCLGGFATALRARLPMRVRAQYLLASMYFLSGWTVLIYMSFPAIRLLAGVQPLAGATADQFLLHFAPYFCASLSTVALAGAGAYTWRAFALAATSFWIHVRASLLALLRRRGRFVVTPKEGADAPQPGAMWPSLLALDVLLGVAAYGLSRHRDPATLNNASFAALHITVLTAGVWPALVGAQRVRTRIASSQLLASGVRRALVQAAVALLAAAAVAGGVLLGERSLTAPVLRTAGPSPPMLARRAGEAFLERYELADGRVVRLDQRADTVSEGQAYAMLIAVALGDHGRFQAAWRWTRANLELPSGLLATRWADGHVVQAQPASDADLDAARALWLAAERFGEARYREQARTLAHAVLANETIDTTTGRLLVAGPWALRERIVDPSYIDPTSFQVLASADPRDRLAWQALERTAHAVLASLLARYRLPPDWAQASPTGALTAIGLPSAPGREPLYSFDAARLPVRLAASCKPDERSLAASLWPTLRAAGQPTPYALALNGAPRTVGSAPLALVGAAAAAGAAGATGAEQTMLAQAETLELHYPTYYGAAWAALGRIMLQTSWLSPCA